ncbi:hypothetical protein L9G16_23040, partial [Shewanella sp. A25]|nr:hypothetical protein [Shewanella shenzhenensis]
MVDLEGEVVVVCGFLQLFYLMYADVLVVELFLGFLVFESIEKVWNLFIVFVLIVSFLAYCLVFMFIVIDLFFD